MPIGGSGVASSPIKGGGQFIELVRLLGDPEGYKKRYDELTAAITKLETDKQDAVKAINTARRDAEQILANARAEAEGILSDAKARVATTDAEIKSARDALAEEKAEWTKEVRSLRASLGASTAAARRAKEESDAAKMDLQGEIAQTHDVRQGFQAAWGEIQEIAKRTLP